MKLNKFFSDSEYNKLYHIQHRNMLRVGVVGASGYVGGEMLRLLVTHPKVEITQVTSRQYVGEYLHRVQPALKGFTEMTFSELDYDKMSDKCDLVFTAVPQGILVGIL